MPNEYIYIYCIPIFYIQCSLEIWYLLFTIVPIVNFKYHKIMNVGDMIFCVCFINMNNNVTGWSSWTNESDV